MMNTGPHREDYSSQRSYWRSLEHLQDGAEASQLAPPGFAPPGRGTGRAAESSARFSRRSLLKLSAASLALAGMTSCRRPVEKIVPYVSPPERVVPGIPRYYATTMPLALSAYGVIVESHEGRPIKIEGNPSHPSSQGASNAIMQAAILGLYDPDRSRSVLHEGEKTTWEAFAQAWKELDQAHLDDKGAGLAILSESFSSPTLTRLKASVLERFPEACWATWEPTSDENLFEGIVSVAREAYRPVYHLDRAQIVLSLDMDFLGTHAENVAFTRGFTSARKVSAEHPTMNRLYAVESAYTVTGANADHRLRLPSNRVGSLVAALATEFRRQGLVIDLPSAASHYRTVPGVNAHWIEAVARDLAAHRGSGLIVAGSHHAPEVHAAVLMLNDALGNVGATLSLHESVDSSPSRAAELGQLVQAMKDGAVSTLLILGGNPVYNAPADLNLVEVLPTVQTVIQLSPYEDETSRFAHWHIPQTHFLEEWGDARDQHGVASVVQPLILPLYGAHSAVEVLAMLSGQEALTGYDQVRATWKGLLGSETFEKQWNRVLHDGLLGDSATPSVGSALRNGTANKAFARLFDSLAAVDTEERGDLELVFTRSLSVFDGRFANNGWLQEMPDTITKLTWDNAAVMSPKTARSQGLRNEDVVRLRLGDRSVEAPVWIVPGHADESVSVALGYGRTAAGRIGNDCGTDVYVLRTSDALGYATGLRIEKTGQTHVLAGTQDHSTMDGRGLVREASLAVYKEDPNFAHHEEHGATGTHLFRDPVDWTQGRQWGMTIDLNACTGCNACLIACQSENNISIVGKEQVKKGREMHWIRIDRYFTSPASDENHPEESIPVAGEHIPDDPQVVFQPMPCQHCETAPCEQVCPVAATMHDREGLNVMVYNRCIGTRYCANNCPYKVRRFNYFNLTKHLPESVKLAQNPDVTVRSRGIMEKCSFCLQRISEAKIQAKRERRDLRDGEIQTACQQACPAQAIQFGNINDAASAVARNKRNERNYVVLGETNMRPRVSYLAKVRNPNPDLVGDSHSDAIG